MNIFDHIIPNRAIVGIGPLMFEQHPQLDDVLLYGKCRYAFDVHLSAHTTQVRSDWFQPRENASEQERIRNWKAEYQRVRDLISEMVGEPTETRLQQVQRADVYHKKIQDNFNQLLMDLAPVEEAKQIVINARIERILSEVMDLKKLALQ